MLFGHFGALIVVGQEFQEGGMIRVGKSRISLDLIVEQYENGMTREEMVQAYDTLTLADVQTAIDYYRQHRDEVRAYLKRRGAEAQALRMVIESKRPNISKNLTRRIPQMRSGGKLT